MIVLMTIMQRLLGLLRPSNMLLLLLLSLNEAGSRFAYQMGHYSCFISSFRCILFRFLADFITLHSKLAVEISFSFKLNGSLSVQASARCNERRLLAMAHWPASQPASQPTSEQGQQPTDDGGHWAGKMGPIWPIAGSPFSHSFCQFIFMMQ